MLANIICNLNRPKKVDHQYGTGPGSSGPAWPRPRARAVTCALEPFSHESDEVEIEPENGKENMESLIFVCSAKGFMLRSPQIYN
jgi:hypothetical protein